MKLGLEPSTQTLPESNATNAKFIGMNNTQSLAGDVMQTMGFLIALLFGWENVTHIVKK